jgi:hypothetical protein
MGTLQTRAVNQLISTLSAMGAKYKIIMPNGTEYGELEIKSPDGKKSKNITYPRGATRAHYEPIVSTLDVGEEAAIPYAHWDATILRSNIHSWCFDNWGSRNYIIERDDTSKVVRVLRLAKG